MTVPLNEFPRYANGTIRHRKPMMLNDLTRSTFNSLNARMWNEGFKEAMEMIEKFTNCAKSEGYATKKILPLGKDARPRVR